MWACFWTGTVRARRRCTPAGQEDTGGSLLREDATKARLPAPLSAVRLRQSYGATGRAAKETCHSTKRTHRFLTDFSMEVTMNTCVAKETCERNRWVRFRKRTHREGVLRGARGRKWGKRSQFLGGGRKEIAAKTSSRRLPPRYSVWRVVGLRSARLGFRSVGVRGRETGAQREGGRRLKPAATSWWGGYQARELTDKFNREKWKAACFLGGVRLGFWR
jgi:hypothetical protein